MFFGLYTMVYQFLRMCGVIWNDHGIAVNDKLGQMEKK